MKTAVLYDSLYGNTEMIAKAIRDSIKTDVKLYSLNTISPSLLHSADLVIVGSPTQGGRPTAGLDEFLKHMPDITLHTIKVAAFDTRFLEKEQKPLLRLLMKVIGYAAPKIAETLKKKGGKLIVPPEGFIVEGKEGPLRKGELQRVSEWVTVILKEVKK